MPKDDYTSVAGGGLRLKGVTDSKITKHKKKRPKHPETEKRSSSAKPDAEASESQEPIHTDDKALTRTSGASDGENDSRERSVDRSEQRGKTEAELRHEERRRRRVCPLIWFPCRSIDADVVCIARGAPQARRYEDAQGARGGVQPLPKQSQRTP